MGYYLSLPVLALAAALQSTLIPQLRIADGQPDLVLLLVLSWSFRARLEEGLTWAFIGGLLQDLLSLTPLGTSSLTLIVISYSAHTIGQQLYSLNPLAIIILGMFSTLAKYSVSVLLFVLIGLRPDLLSSIRYVLMPTLLYNLLLLLPIYGLVRFIQVRLVRNPMV